MNTNKLSEKFKLIYSVYPFSTNKVARAYYRSPYYRKMVDILKTYINHPELCDQYYELAPSIEYMRVKEFELLCNLERNGQLDDLVKLIKNVVRG